MTAKKLRSEFSIGRDIIPQYGVRSGFVEFSAATGHGRLRREDGKAYAAKMAKATLQRWQSLRCKDGKGYAAKMAMATRR
jgi:hypothetical protein